MEKDGASARRTFSRTTARKTTFPKRLRRLSTTSRERFVRVSTRQARTAENRSRRFRRSRTRSTVETREARPERAMTWASTGTKTSRTATRAEIANRPRDGGQSTKTKSHRLAGRRASLCSRIVSAPTSPERAFSTPTIHEEEGTSSTPGAGVSRTRSKRFPLSVNTSKSPRPLSAAAPSQAEAEACGSRSTTRTRFPFSPSAAARFTAVVVFPLPPF